MLSDALSSARISWAGSAFPSLAALGDLHSTGSLDGHTGQTSKQPHSVHIHTSWTPQTRLGQAEAKRTEPVSGGEEGLARVRYRHNHDSGGSTRSQVSFVVI